MCLNELQSIIDVKAAERQKRELSALTRMIKSAVTPVSHISASGEGNGWKGDEGKETLATAQRDDSAGGMLENVDGGMEDETNDLSQDIAERVLFWKHFDLTENVFAPKMQDSVSRSPDIEAGTAEDELGVDNFLLIGDRKSSSESPQSDISIIPDIISSSTSQESGFVVVDDQQSEPTWPTSKARGMPLSESWHHIPEDISESVPKGRSESLQKKRSACEGDTVSRSAKMENLELIKKPSPLSGSSVSQAEARSRSQPEGTEEHLSLPGSPSPFVFSIATMVASKARNIAQVEDTFGDTSSDEEKKGE